MAGIDYCSCNECGVRLFYDGDGEVRRYMAERGTAKYIICDKCHKKLLKRVDKLEADKKRGR